MITKAKDIDYSRLAFDAESSWGRCLSSWLRQAHERSGSIHTLTHYQQLVTDFFSNPVKMPDVYDRSDIEKFIYAPRHAKGRTGPPGPGTINNRLSALSSFYTYAAGFTIANEQAVLQPVLRTIAPTTGIHQLRRPRLYHILTASDIERLLAVIPKDTETGLKYRALFITYLFTARRNSEILQLRFGDIERVTISEKGQPRETFQYAFYGKGRKRYRDHAELPGPAASAIFAYLEQSGRLATIQPEDAIFTSNTTYRGRKGYDSKRPLSPATIWDAAKRYARAAGLAEESVNIHMFRHVSSRTRYDQGEDIRSIQNLLRHSSLATTDVYLREISTVSDQGAKLLGTVFGNL